MRLYYNKYTRATRVRWLLEEMGLPYDLVTLDLAAGEHKTEAYTRIHPLGRVPALEHDGNVIFESGAICLYLADRFPEKGLAPPAGSSSRAHYYQWVVFATAELEPPVARWFYESRRPSEEQDRSLLEGTKRDFAERAAVVNRTLEGRDWLLGEFSAADVPMASVVMWANRLGLCEPFPALQRYALRASDRPAQRASRA